MFKCLYKINKNLLKNDYFFVFNYIFRRLYTIITIIMIMMVCASKICIIKGHTIRDKRKRTKLDGSYPFTEQIS